MHVVPTFLQPFLIWLIASLTGIPALVAFPPGCRSLRCMSRWVSFSHHSSGYSLAMLTFFLINAFWWNVSWLKFKTRVLTLNSIQFPAYCILLMILHYLVRYDGELSVDSVTDWVAMSILSLPRIRYYSKESMVKYVIYWF